MHVNIWIFKQLPLVPMARLQHKLAWSGLSAQDWILPRVLELTYTAWDLETFAIEMEHSGPPFRWDMERRFVLRCELDAAFFRLYGISREDAGYVLDTFSIVQKNDKKVYGEYRTKRVILEIYDNMVDAENSRTEYRTLLNPAAANSAVAHPLRVPALPPMPAATPQMPPADEAAFVIWALLYAGNGSLTRTDLARAYALRERPDLLRRFAPPSLAQAGEWAMRVGARSVVPGLFAGTIKALSDRNGAALGLNAESQSTISIGPNTPVEELIDPWFRFEARLALQVLRALPATAFDAIDSSVLSGDRALLERIS